MSVQELQCRLVTCNVQEGKPMSRQWMTSGTLSLSILMTGAGVYAQSATAPRGQHPQSASSQMGQSDVQSTQFVEKMLMANMAEIKLGQLGVDRATSPDVKSFAQMMVTDHTQANQELMPIAQQLGVKQPKALDAKHRAVSAKLAKLKGAEFDRQFMKAMVDGHQEVVREVRPVAGASASRTAGGSSTAGSAGTSGSTGTSGTAAGAATSAGASGTGGASAKEYAAKTLPTIEHHLQQAKQIEQAVGK
jgi:predicted outer membrane protein